ncbi:MAG: cation:proton antiporter, partial [Myxococcales bacterium]|nr:cation:proton antiporter [Myxococcales bacterium]
PAATIAVINDLGATGPLSRTTLTTVVLGDVPVVVIFAVTSVLAGSVLGVSSGEQSLGTYLATHIAGSLAVGVGLGAVLALYVRYINRELLLFLVASIYAGSLIIKAGEFDPVLTFLGAGFVVANFSKGAEPLIESVERLSKPVYVLFFALAGAKLHLQELATAWWVAVILAGSRLLAVRSGARFGAKIAGSPQVVQDNVWLGLISQAGVSLALAGIIGSRFGDFGARLQTVLVSAIGIHEFIGPVLLKFGLSRAGEIQGQRETTSPGERTSSAPPPRLSMADDVDLELLARRASPWGPPAETASDALNQALEKLREDLDRAMHAAESASVERFQSSVESFVGELRREFQRHHRRALLRVREANGDAVKVAAVLHAELAHLAERWRSAALARSARLAQANWSPDSLIEVVDRIVEALPEGIDAPYEARALDTRVRRRFVAALGARWLRIRRRAARMVRVELRRTVQLRALARYHLAGLVPGRLEPFVVLLVDAELRVARETRGLLDRVARQNVEIEELLARPEKVNVEQELERVREAFEDHVTQFEKSFVNQVVRTRDKLEDAIARSYSDVRHEAAVFGTPDLPLRQRRTNRVFRDRMRALDVFGDRLERVRQVVSATYTQIALECELVALEARIRDVIADHAKQFARNVRGRTHVQAERLVEALDGLLPTMAETVEAEQQGEALEQALEAQMEPLKRTAHEVARQSNLVVEELSREAVLKPLLDALRAATRSLSDRYEIPSGPLMLGDQRLEAPSSIVAVPFRELVTAHVETSVVPNLLDVMREVRDLIKPFSQTLQDVERAMAFNLELVVNELELFHGRAVTEEVREVVRELLLATVEKHRDMARGLEKKASAWPGTLREGVDRAVLGSVADLRGQLMDGELSQIRVAMMRRSAAGKKLVFQANRLPALFPEFREAVRRATSGLVREEQLDAWREELGIPRRRK